MSLRFALALLLATPLAAQAVLRVGPGGHAQIRDAILAAAPGDVIEVAAGTYLPFTLDKPLTITALPAPPGQIVQVTGAVTMTPSITELRPPAGTRAFVTNVHFRNMWANYWQHSVRVTRGTACFEECTFEAPYDLFEPALRVQNAAVQLRHCLARGAPTARCAAATASAAPAAMRCAT